MARTPAPPAVSFDVVRASEIVGSVVQRSTDAAANKLSVQSTAAGDSTDALAQATTKLAWEGPSGLALSGGGIRSATFSLGVLQSLAAQKKLSAFDYLSTVSGGGYIGGWLSAWIARTPSGVNGVETELGKSAATGHPEPKQVQWLRRYSNYLTPRVGALSLDALTVATTWLRNVFLNLIVLVSFFAVIFLIPIVLFTRWGFWLSNYPNLGKAIAVVGAMISLAFASVNLAVKSAPDKSLLSSVLSPSGVLCGVVLPGFCACFGATFWLLFGDFANYSPLEAVAWALLIFLAGVGIAWTIGLAIAKRLAKAAGKPAPEPAAWRDAGVYALASIPAVVVGAALLTYVRHWLVGDGQGPINPNHQMIEMITWGPPAILLSFGICLSIWIGLVGRTYQEPSREWWSRAGGSFLIISVACFAWFAFAFYVPYWARNTVADFPAWSTTAKTIASSAWFASLVGALRLAVQTSQPKASRTPTWRTLIGTVLAGVFAVGLVGLIACGVHAVLDWLANYFGAAPDNSANYWMRLNNWRHDSWMGIACDLTLFLTALAVMLIFAWRVDINRFSLHNMYKNRIIRCYLGASNPNRKPQLFTGFDSSDDVPLIGLMDSTTKRPQKPCHIINTAMNLVQGSELAWQQRKASSFVLMPNYCGFAMAAAQGDTSLAQAQLPGFQPTSIYATEDPGREDLGFSLGMAVATSGAAVSPNMGANTQPALAALTTLFDIRLGRWSPNPAGKTPKKASPRFGLAWLISELLGFTNERRNFVYLSDGGHFENMGIYELVRRRCRRIVAVDAGADPNRTFEDLGNMLRKCRVDLNTPIELDLKELYARGDDARSRSGVAHGFIHYPEGPGGQRDVGEILMIKPTLCRPVREPADIFNYASNTAFPQESTADQWFDESQFESYRSLGYALATQALNAFPSFI
jgi:Patatin-like phospholipase